MEYPKILKSSQSTRRSFFSFKIIQRVFCGSETQEQQVVNENDEVDEDSMWNNRISLAKKIAKSSLSTLMEQHKTSASVNSSFMQSNDEIKKNFDENMRRVSVDLVTGSSTTLEL